MRSANRLVVVATVVGSLALSCGGSSSDSGGDGDTSGGASGTGGTPASGGTGMAGSGGDAAGGTGTGGSATGGSATGGSPTGGATTGGAAGSSTGGDSGSAPGGSGGQPGGAAGAGAGIGGAGAGGASGGAGTAGKGGSAGAAGSAGASARCQGVPATCGPTGTSDCCASSLVPAGTFNRSNLSTAPATVSAFRLDIYEVTLGRYRRFLAALPGSIPASGSGRNPNDPNDTGWNAAWNASIETDLSALNTRLNRCAAHTWTEQPGANETQPMNCISWFEAAAFCIFDGGRLPTEAEWNYAAAGGAEQRVFPWSNPPASTTVDTTYATYQGVVTRVGSKSPKGDGRWGHADLAGSVFEWAADYVENYPVPCVDCALHTPTMWRSDRGGGITPSTTQLETGYRGNLLPDSAVGHVGVRCARTP